MRFGLAFGLFALAATAFGDSIVVNGNFATGDSTGWTQSDWYVFPASEATGGAPASFFSGTGCVGSTCITTPDAFIEQVLVTNPGDTYDISFDYSPDVFNLNSNGFAELV